MKCEKTAEITDYLKGETAPEERETLRLHFEGCEVCSKEIGKFDRVLQALGRLEEVEPSVGFKWRVREAFVRAHPDFLEAPRRTSLTFWQSVREQFSFVPAWAVSIAAHVILLAVAAILFFGPQTPEEIERDLAVGSQPLRPPGEQPEFKTPSDLSKAAPAEKGAVDPSVPEDFNRPPREGAPSIRVRKPGRDPEEMKLDAKTWRERIPREKRLLAYFEARGRDPQQSETRAAFGGEGTEGAIRAALGALARMQRADGSWSGPSVRQEGGHEGPYSAGLTGLALLAFLGEGHTGRSGDHALTVKRGLEYLLLEQRASGLIGPDAGNYMYNHAIAALALLEASLSTRDEPLASAAAAAVSFTVRAQNDSGGWGYTARAPESDTSVGGWQILLLRMAKLGGNQGVIPSLVQAASQLQVVTDAEGKVGYRARVQFPNGPYALTAVGMFAHQMATHTPDPALLARQSSVLLERAAVPGTEPARHLENDLYFAHFGSLALHQLGGDAWQRWWAPVKASLLKSQGADGSWPADFDRWHGYGGQVYTTAMAALILETPVRYPRLAE
jgi:hypothetical protein